MFPQVEDAKLNRHVIVGMLSLGAMALAAGCGSDSTTGVASETFSASLNGGNEKPTARTTTGTGTATLLLRRDTLSWTVTMANMINVTAAHIHIGGPDVAGGVILPLTGAAGSFSNTLIAGLVTRGTYVPPGPPNAAVTFDSLLVLMRNNGSYVNVHTSDPANPANDQQGDFPAGEIRGQVVKTN